MKHLLLLALVACTHHRAAATWKDPAGKFTVELGAYKLVATFPHNGHTEYHFERPGSIDGVGIAYIDAVADYDRAVASARCREWTARRPFARSKATAATPIEASRVSLQEEVAHQRDLVGR